MPRIRMFHERGNAASGRLAQPDSRVEYLAGSRAEQTPARLFYHGACHQVTLVSESLVEGEGRKRCRLFAVRDQKGRLWQVSLDLADGKSTVKPCF